MSWKDESEWLQNLKAGDEVVLFAGGYRSHRRIATLDRTTKTQIIVGSQKYSRSHGLLIGGGSWNTHSLRKPTDEIRANILEEMRREDAISIISRAKLDNYNTLRDMPLDNLEALAEAVKSVLEVE